MKRIINSVTAIIFIALFSCNEGITNPEPDYPPGRRDYIWVADTIKGYFLDYYGIWGDSINNVWAVSHSGSSSEAIIKYNGERWEFQGHTGVYSPISVFGIQNEIWFGQDEGKIWHYTEDTYTKVFDYGIDTSIEDLVFLDICGKDRNEIYMTGSYEKKTEAILFTLLMVLYTNLTVQVGVWIGT